MQGLFWNYLELLDSFLGAVDLLEYLPWLFEHYLRTRLGLTSVARTLSLN